METLKSVETSAGTIRYRDTGSGETLVFVHGLLANGMHWRKVIPHLQNRYRCIVPDLPLGVHQPWMKPEADLSLPGLARILQEFLEAVGLTSVTLIGNDTGGAICQMMIPERSDRLARLVLANCDSYDNFLPVYIRHIQYGAHLPGYIWLTAQLLRIRWIRNLPIAFGLLTKYPLDQEVSDTYASMMRMYPGTRRDFGKVCRAVSKKYTIEADRSFQDFNRPVLILWAPEDRFFPLRYGERLAARFPNASLRLIPDSYVFIPEDQPQTFAEELRAWLNTHPLKTEPLQLPPTEEGK